MRTLRVAASAAFGFSLLATGSAGAAPHAEPLRAFVQRLLVAAPTNFSSLRGAPKGSESYYSSYTVVTTRNACPKCELTDEYAWTAHNENWYIENQWHGAKGSPQATLISYVTSQLTPSLKAYSLKTTDGKDYPTFRWTSTKGTWVYVHVYKGGFTVRVGHDVKKPVHVLLAPSVKQLAALRAGVSSFVSSGVAAASNNFETLRAAGKKDVLDEMAYDLYVPFGAMLPKCQIVDASANRLNLADYSPKWTMNCDTPPMVGTKAVLEEQIRAAMQNALPSGFSPTTGRALFLDDYRWDNASTQVAVDVNSVIGYELPDGLVQFSLGIIHFLPNQN